MKLFKNMALYCAIVASFFLVGCEAEPGGGGGTGGNEGFPDVSINGPGAEVTASIGDTIYYTVAATKGESPLKTIVVQENGVNLPLERVLYDGVSVANPLLLLGADKTSFSKVVGIITASTVGTLPYKIIVSDDGNRNVTSDIKITTSALPPSIAFSSSMSGDVTLGVSSLQNFPITATKGTGALKSITVLENDQPVDPSRILFGSGGAATENPIILSGDQVNGLDNVDLTIRSNEAPGTYAIKIVVTDEFDLTDELALTMNVGIPVVAKMGVLFNQAGPAGTGGLDLDEALGTGSQSSLAEIRDQGIDGDGNWLKKIATVNGSEIKRIVPGQNGVAEDFVFDNVTFKSQVTALFGNGTDYADEVVEKGNMFAVKRDDNYYFIRIADITETAGDNSDSYTVDIKR